MTVYAQLDSVGDSLVIADCGLLYVFLCFGCFETKVLRSDGVNRSHSLDPAS
jgi:hypothetical protein